MSLHLESHKQGAQDSACLHPRRRYSHRLSRIVQETSQERCSKGLSQPWMGYGIGEEKSCRQGRLLHRCQARRMLSQLIVRLRSANRSKSQSRLSEGLSAAVQTETSVEKCDHPTGDLITSLILVLLSDIIPIFLIIRLVFLLGLLPSNFPSISRLVVGK